MLTWSDWCSREDVRAVAGDPPEAGRLALLFCFFCLLFKFEGGIVTPPGTLPVAMPRAEFTKIKFLVPCPCSTGCSARGGGHTIFSVSMACCLWTCAAISERDAPALSQFACFAIFSRIVDRSDLQQGLFEMGGRCSCRKSKRERGQSF